MITMKLESTKKYSVYWPVCCYDLYSNFRVPYSLTKACMMSYFLAILYQTGATILTARV